MDNSRLADIESSMAFQDRTIEDLSEVVRQQQQDIDSLRALYEKVMARLERAEDADTDKAGLEFEPPPNY